MGISLESLSLMKDGMSISLELLSLNGIYTLYMGISFESLSLNQNFDGREARKFLSYRSCCVTLLNPIPTLTTELLLVCNPYPKTPAGLSE